MRIFRNFNYFCFVFNFHLYRILQQWHWFTSVPFFIHREKLLKNKSFELYDCFVLRKVCRSKIIKNNNCFASIFFYLKRILNFSETSVTYNCSLFSTIFIEICPWWVLIAKLRNPFPILLLGLKRIWFHFKLHKLSSLFDLLKTKI